MGFSTPTFIVYYYSFFYTLSISIYLITSECKSIAFLYSAEATENKSTSGYLSSILICPEKSTLFAILILAVVKFPSTLLPEQISILSLAFMLP